ncbi:MAG: phosphoadenylyl-sulfate reductase [Armatimonadota bacterium]
MAIDVEIANRGLGGLTAPEILQWALEEFGDRIALASSFGAEDVALIDMLTRFSKHPRVFVLDTGRLHEATYEVMERIRGRYGVRLEIYSPQREGVERLEREEGLYSFRRSLEARHACCFIRKVEPLGRAVSGLGAWITGMRREQSVTRIQAEAVENDPLHPGVVKVNPLIDWTTGQVWDYIHRHDVPYNTLHDMGYPSIGCEPCTRAIQAGEHPRAGRWWWEEPEQKECGLHGLTESGARA